MEAKEISTGGDPNYDAAERARPIVITGTGTKVEAERIDCLTTITVSGSAGVTVKNTSGIAMSASYGIKIEEGATVTAHGTTGGLNSFSGSIEIAGTVDAKVTGSGINAAVSAGTAGIEKECFITVTGTLTASGALGAGVPGPGNITIDGGTVIVNATFAGIYPMGAGNVEIKNSANVTAGVTSATDIPTGPGIHVKGGSISISNSTVESSTESSSYYALGATPTLTYNDSYKVYAGASREDAALIPHADLTAETYQNNYVKIEPASSAQAAPAAAPELAGSTTTSITLKEITANENSAAAQYGISTDGGKTWVWQDSPEFTDLTSSTAYTFAVRYGATEDGNYAASPASPTAAFSTAQPSVVVPVTPTYPPAVEAGDNGTVSVVPANPQQGSTVTVTPSPDRGYEVDSITVTDQNGNPVAVTDNGDGTFRFTQPAGKVTISVSYVCDGQTDNCPSYHLADVDASAWYHLAVDFVMENGLMNGYGNGSFGPNDTLTRAELAQILYNKEGRPSASGSVFADVADSAWYVGAVVWASRNGIVDGYGSGRFGPNDPITREQLAVMLWRYAGCPAPAQKELRFTDADKVSSWAWEAVLWATESGVLNGYGGALHPRGTATRAEAAQMLKNFMENT